MAIYNIVQIGDDILRQQAQTVKRFDKRLATLLDDMADTLYEEDGAGLAAPQIGISKRVVVIDVGDGLVELVNPLIIKAEGREVEIEGCLSVKGRNGYVPRGAKVVVTAQNRNGGEFVIEGTGMLARALQHEIDHLNGILFVDKMTKEVSLAELEELAKEE